MSKDWKNAKPLKTAIKLISVLNEGLKNMFLSHVKVDYAPPAARKPQTNGPIKYTIFF
jgi:hypothetical protein